MSKSNSRLHLGFVDRGPRKAIYVHVQPEKGQLQSYTDKTKGAILAPDREPLAYN